MGEWIAAPAVPPPLERAECPFRTMPALEVRFQDWTGDGRIRFPVYLGFRQDKRPEDVVRKS